MRANSSRFCSSRSASFHNRRPRSDGVVRRQGPSSNALRAALTAASMSALPPDGTLQMVSPVAGLTVANVSPENAETHLPLINISLAFAVAPLARAARRLGAAELRRDEGSLTFIVLPLVKSCVAAYQGTVGRTVGEARQMRAASKVMNTDAVDRQKH